MDEFARGTAAYDEAHGLYVRGRRLRVVSPGERVPTRLWKRVGSVAHPGITRETLSRAGGGLALAEGVKHYGISGSGQGCDISEFQASTPPGFAFYVVRAINEYGRTDSRLGQHVGNVRSWGAPLGSYGIIRPGAIDPGTWASRYVELLRRYPTDFVPVIDVELGDANACRAFVADALPIIRGAGYPIVMGYYSTGSSYRYATQDLFDRHWGACWGCAYPSWVHMHQWQGSPLDRDYCPNYEPISQGGGGPPPPPPHGGGDEMYPRNPYTGAIWCLTGGVGGLKLLDGDGWAYEQWFMAATWGVPPNPVDFQNDDQLLRLCRERGVDDWTIQVQTGIDLGASPPNDLNAVNTELDNHENRLDALEAGGGGPVSVSGTVEVTGTAQVSGQGAVSS